MMNKRGSLGMALVIACIIFVFGVLFLPFLTDDITSARTDVDCSNSSIRDGSKLTCLGFSLVIPYFIWFILSLSVGFIAGAFT